MIWKRLGGALAFAVFLLVLAAALRSGVGAGFVSPEVARRVVQVVVGLMLAVYASAIPKDSGPWPSSSRAAAVSLAVRRVGGWSMWLAGVSYAVLWAFAPLEVAKPASVLTVVIAMLVMFSYAVRAFALCRRTP